MYASMAEAAAAEATRTGGTPGWFVAAMVVLVALAGLAWRYWGPRCPACGSTRLETEWESVHSGAAGLRCADCGARCLGGA